MRQKRELPRGLRGLPNPHLRVNNRNLAWAEHRSALHAGWILLLEKREFTVWGSVLVWPVTPPSWRLPCRREAGSTGQTRTLPGMALP